VEGGTQCAEKELGASCSGRGKNLGEGRRGIGTHIIAGNLEDP